MAASTLTSKGQTTIPLEVREFLKIKSGDRLEFLISKAGEVLLKPAHVELKSLKGILKKGYKGQTISLQEMDEAIRKRSRRGA